MKIVAIVQARMGSTRLPGKVLMELCGKTMLEVLLHRLSNTNGIDQIVVATTTLASDDVLENWLKERGIAYYRGSEEDVLDRFFQCAKYFNADVIIRVTADDPLKDPEIIGLALSKYLENPTLDYVSNTLYPTFPEGLDIEIFGMKTLTATAMNAKLKSEREHVTPYIWKNPQLFSLFNIEMKQNLSSWRWTVDKLEDLHFVRKLFALCQNNIDASYLELINKLTDKPELMQINSSSIRNEGYIKSISME